MGFCSCPCTHIPVCIHLSVYQNSSDVGACVLDSLDDGYKIFSDFLSHSGICYDVECSRSVWRLVIIEPLHHASFSEYRLYEFRHCTWCSCFRVPQECSFYDIPLCFEVHALLVVWGSQFHCQYIEYLLWQFIYDGECPCAVGQIQQSLVFLHNRIADT